MTPERLAEIEEIFDDLADMPSVRFAGKDLLTALREAQAEVERLKTMMITGNIVIGERDVELLNELFQRRWKGSFERVECERDALQRRVEALEEARG